MKYPNGTVGVARRCKTSSKAHKIGEYYDCTWSSKEEKWLIMDGDGKYTFHYSEPSKYWLFTVRAVQPSVFKAGMKVRNKTGETFSNDKHVVTLNYLSNGNWYLKETGTYVSEGRIEPAEHPCDTVVVNKPTEYEEQLEVPEASNIDNYEQPEYLNLTETKENIMLEIKDVVLVGNVDAAKLDIDQLSALIKSEQDLLDTILDNLGTTTKLIKNLDAIKAPYQANIARLVSLIDEKAGALNVED